MSTGGAVISRLPMGTLSWQVIKGAFKINAPFLMVKNVIGIAKGDKIIPNLLRLLSSLGGIGGSIALSTLNPAFYAYFAGTLTALFGGVTLPPILLSILVYGLTGLLGGTAGQILSKIAIGVTMLLHHGYSNPALYSNPNAIVEELINNGSLTLQEGEAAKYLLQNLPHLMQGYKKGSEERHEVKQAFLDVKSGNIGNAHAILKKQAAKQESSACAPTDEVDASLSSSPTFSPQYRSAIEGKHAANLNIVVNEVQRRLRSPARQFRC